MFLDINTLKAMTKYEYPKYMCKYFRERGYKFETDRYGYPLVLISAVEQRLGTPIEAILKKRNEPDFDALDQFNSPKRKKNGSK